MAAFRDFNHGISIHNAKCYADSPLIAVQNHPPTADFFVSVIQASNKQHPLSGFVWTLTNTIYYALFIYVLTCYSPGLAA